MKVIRVRANRAKLSKRAELFTHLHASVKNLFGKLFCHARVVPTCNSYLLTRHRVSTIVFSGTRTLYYSKCGAKTAHKFISAFFYPESSSMVNLTLETLFHQKAKEKTTTYSNAAEQRRAAFNPFIATCDAVLDINAEYCAII